VKEKRENIKENEKYQGKNTCVYPKRGGGVRTKILHWD
jgi:hypothetical protein